MNLRHKPGLGTGSGAATVAHAASSSDLSGGGIAAIRRCSLARRSALRGVRAILPDRWRSMLIVVRSKVIRRILRVPLPFPSIVSVEGDLTHGLHAPNHSGYRCNGRFWMGAWICGRTDIALAAVGKSICTIIQGDLVAGHDFNVVPKFWRDISVSIRAAE